MSSLDPQAGPSTNNGEENNTTTPAQEGSSDPTPPTPCSNAKCLKLTTLCPTCLATTRRIHSSVPYSQLESRTGWFPISITVHVTGTQAEIQAWVWKQISRLHLFYPARSMRRDTQRGKHKHPRVRVCAVERARDASAGGGDFADFADLMSPRPGALSVQEVSWQETATAYWKYALPHAGMGVESEGAQERRVAKAKMPWYAKARARSAAREVCMLVEFPEEIGEGDEVLGFFLDGFGGRVEVVEVKFPGPGTSWNAHRLAWWVYTHPAENGNPGITVPARRSGGQSASQQQRQRQQTYQHRSVPTRVAWVTPVSVDPNVLTTRQLPTAREGPRTKSKTPRWIRNLGIKL
ncbi:hypothetical protein BJY00DRAFT_311410 [Aspergillus carlsbadensis]|nr:hypothetical protein BJY00DRAFT_311410 [Aspergillus carlsbadensis]